jgi:hypothetical protein
VTIAACYVSPEGIVLGADSATTYGEIHYNNSQKLFELGEDSTLGVVTWGLGGLQVNSHRTLFALLADDLDHKPAKDIVEIATRWTDLFWSEYTNPQCPIAPFLQRCQALDGKAAYDPALQNPGARNQDEEREFHYLRTSLVAGFCVAGYLRPDRTPGASEIIFDPLQGKPTPASLPFGYRFWGAPNMIQRLLFGCDDELKSSLVASGHWNGTRADLEALVSRHALGHPIVPIRDAIDFVHACVSSTIKAFKFSSLSQICGGPIEIAVITTDRNFRWVRHKAWDAAITEGDRNV